VSSKSVVLNDRLANDVRRNGTHSSGTDDDCVLHALVRNEMCWLISIISYMYRGVQRHPWRRKNASRKSSEGGDKKNEVRRQTFCFKGCLSQMI